jgi:hypothetical protein
MREREREGRVAGGNLGIGDVGDHAVQHVHLQQRRERRWFRACVRVCKRKADTETHRHRERWRDGERRRETERQRDRDRKRQRDTDRETVIDRDRDRDRDKDRQRNRDGQRDRAYRPYTEWEKNEDVSV